MKTQTIKLQEPVQWGKDEIVETLDLKPTPRAYKDLSLSANQDGKFDFRPYDLAKIGVQMAGRPAAFADKLSIPDMMEVATAVMLFLAPAQTTGIEPLP